MDIIKFSLKWRQLKILITENDKCKLLFDMFALFIMPFPETIMLYRAHFNTSYAHLKQDEERADCI